MKNRASDSNLDFAGMAGTGVGPASRSGVCANPYSIGDKALSQNYGSGPRRGNASSAAMSLGAPPARKTIATAAQGGRINGGAEAKCPANPGKINAGAGPRKGNM